MKGYEKVQTIPFMQPSAMAPRARIPLSLTSQRSEKRASLRIGKRWTRKSSPKMPESTSKEAAAHFPNNEEKLMSGEIMRMRYSMKKRK
jgi:hypothetical protein